MNFQHCTAFWNNTKRTLPSRVTDTDIFVEQVGSAENEWFDPIVTWQDSSRCQCIWNTIWARKAR